MLFVFICWKAGWILNDDVPPMKRGKRALLSAEEKGETNKLRFVMNLNFFSLPCTPQWFWSESW